MKRHDVKTASMSCL